MSYAIWDKKSTIYTPGGGKYTAEMWIARHPILENPQVIGICWDGEYNGAVFATLAQLEQDYAKFIDFSVCNSNQEKIELINNYIKKQEEKAIAKAQEPSVAERQAIALEAIANGTTAESSAIIDALLGEDESEEL